MSKFPVLGIDFGTTHTTAAWVANGILRQVPVTPGVYTLPSVVHILPNGKAIVGAAALDKISSSPDRTFTSIKRFLGRRFSSSFIARCRDRFPYPIIAGPDGLAATMVDGQVLSFEVVVSHIIMRIVELANAAAGFTFEECVLTVPAHFTHRQRRSLRDVVRQVLDVKSIVNEPTAAAVAYTHQRGQSDFAELLVYDLGGGTFDTTLMRANQALVEVMGTGGDAFLGGADFDERIVELFFAHLERHAGINVRGDAIVVQRLTMAAERAKIALSDIETYDVRLPLVAQDGDRFIDLNVRLTRKDVERVCAPLIERTVGICEELVKSTDTHQVDGFIFVGGQTKMPAIRRRLAQIFPGIDTSLDPETAVAGGAAWIGAGVRALLDVLSVPISVVLAGQPPIDALPRHTPVPVTRRVPITSRPAPGLPLVIAVFQSVDMTSIERDTLGVVKVDHIWLADNPGDLTLEVRMTSAFELKLVLHSPRGARLPLELRPPMAPPKVPSVAPISLSTRNDRPIRAATLGVKDSEGLIRWYQGESITVDGAILGTTRPFPAGSLVELGVMLPGRPSRFQARVENAEGRAGMVVRFQLPEAVKSAFAAYLEKLPLVDRSADSDAQRISRFVGGIESKNAYSALQVATDSPPAILREAVGVVRGALARQRCRSPASLAKRLEKLEVALDNTSRLLLGGYSRLVHDFRLGRVNALDRISAATPKQLEVMRAAWKKVYPDLPIKSSLEQQRAKALLTAGDLSGALVALERAVEFDPFHIEIRRRCYELRAQAS